MTYSLRRGVMSTIAAGGALTGSHKSLMTQATVDGFEFEGY